ncbi:single-stranded DNA-binding protein [Campylobacter lari]|uniref:single-stranded DNA-binding protein n=1 Tax=Campylobacter lari TaxID=201 RepID=UPI0012831625|nr:single-stranded DNA-binding protein [Campylobacter lari]MPB21545.1 single-stranded DNA-binding protein [Campylobacter coli]MPB36407.1 single-stranded DNA-binding protein [Campylobacter upsaliensis]EAK0794225.1 hypothetical protein [Campylobacter lari]EDP6895789.1 single-stranded DNA-binding protein [Campylobacter lari]EIY6495419.1 single-stranded DNA-binding protein [Campylobacter lari]
MNKVFLSGYLKNDFEISEDQEKNIIMVKNEIVANKHIIPIVIFGKKAEIATKYFKKDEKFYCNGELISIDTIEFGTGEVIERSYGVKITNFKI